VKKDAGQFSVTYVNKIIIAQIDNAPNLVTLAVTPGTPFHSLLRRINGRRPGLPDFSR
jgi:hypothetical protein